MFDKLLKKLTSISPWHFIWMAVLFSEIFTFILNIILGPIFYGHISVELIKVGAIDAFIVSLVVGSLIIYFVNKIKHDRVANEQLVLEVENRKKIEQELRKAKARWEETFDTINDAITIHDKATATIPPMRISGTCIVNSNLSEKKFR